MVKERKNRANISVNDILKVARRVELQVDFGLTLTQIQDRLDAAWLEYKKVKENSPELRQEFLRSLAEAKAAAENTQASTKLRQLMHAEDQRRQARAIKYTTGKLHGNGLTRVLIKSTDGGSDTEVTDRPALEKLLLRSNPLKYHQCEKYCDLMKGKILADVGLCGEGPGVADILDGTYVCPPGTSEGTRLFLESMKRHPGCDKVRHLSQRSDLREFQSRWKRAKESSSSFGPLHNGHFKAGCEHHSLRYLHFACAEILYATGYYLDRHRSGTDVMLLKAQNNYYLDRLRTICLLDSETNMNMGRVGTDGLDALLALGDMADEQYSRPCRSAIDHVINRRLSFDYFMFCRCPFALCSCDLAGNYDCIAHAAASLALQRVGVPLSRIHGLFDTLQRMIKKVRTAYGDSDGTYGGDDIPFPFTLKPMGVYQGNRIGPPIWSVISSTVFAILRRKGFGVNYIRALSEELYHLVGFAYVDDTDLIQSGGDSFQVAQDMQLALSLWEDIMRATGQSMAPEKSWWYLVDFVWRKGKWSFADGACRTDLIATDTDGRKVSLKRLVFSEAKKMLGVYLSPNGDRTAEFNYLRDKAQRWADMIRVGHLGPTDVWVALSSGIWKTLLYPLPVTTFTDKELTSIAKPIYDVALPRMGLHRTTSIALRHGPRRLGGYSLVSLPHFQGISKIQYLVEHPWKGTPTGKVLNANVDCLVLECGVYGNIFSIPSDPLQWTTATDSWVGYTWAFMHAHGITIDNFDNPFLHPTRHNDLSIMSAFAEMGAPKQVLQALNRCRLYLQIISLSDVSTADGRSLDQSILYHSRRPPEPRHRNSYQWPYQPCPTRPDWLLWNEFLLSCFCSGTDHSLKQKLGPYIDDPRLTKPAWDWFGAVINDEVTTVWNYRDCRWFKYRPSDHSRTRQHRYFPLDEPLPEPSMGSFCLLTVQVDSLGAAVVLSCSDHFLVRPSPPPAVPPLLLSVQSDAFLTELRSCKEYMWFLRQVETPQDISAIVRDFLRGAIYCVSDGSFHPTRLFGTANWRIEDGTRRKSLRGSCVVPGERKKQSSFRSELAGLLGLSSFLWALSRICVALGFPGNEVWDIIVGCDGYSALQRSLLSSPDRLSTSYDHFDLVSAIMGFWRDMPCSSFPIHIRSHQDLVCPRRHLSRLELMNISCDKAARSYLHACIAARMPCPPTGEFTFGLPIVRFRGKVITSDLKKTLLDLCSRDTLLQYWQSNWKFSDHEFQSLAWDSFERAMSMTSRCDQQIITKWLSRMVTVGATIRRYNSSMPKRCLRCGKSEETLPHCLRCPTIRAYILRQLDHFYSVLADYGTCPDLLSGIRICTHHWLIQSRERPSHFLLCIPNADVVFALSAQYRFGWYNFLQGLHLQQISDVQRRFFSLHHPSKSITFWHGRVIHSLWKILIALRSERSSFLRLRAQQLDPSFPAVPLAFDACRSELRLGLASLPPLYATYFRHSAHSLLCREVSQVRSWLRTIRVAREASGALTDPPDEFSPDGSYREWLMSL